ncbi:hypothetical protein Cfor_06830, partial [Coptotermes formosanus]
MCPFRMRLSLQTRHGFTWMDTLREVQLHVEKVGVWYAVSHRRIVGPVLVECTVGDAVYRDLVLKFVALLELDERDRWFQQDGANRCTANETINIPRGCFSDRLVSANIWPTRSHDLTPPDFFF